MMDHTRCGIIGATSKIARLLERHEPQLYAVLEQQARIQAVIIRFSYKPLSLIIRGLSRRIMAFAGSERYLHENSELMIF
jgi:hypothetical protein